MLLKEQKRTQFHRQGLGKGAKEIYQRDQGIQQVAGLEKLGLFFLEEVESIGACLDQDCDEIWESMGLAPILLRKSGPESPVYLHSHHYLVNASYGPNSKVMEGIKWHIPTNNLLTHA